MPMYQSKKISYLTMIKKRITAAIILILIIAFVHDPSGAYGQGRNQEVTIIAPYQPTISEANKLSINPELLELEVKIPEIDYSIGSAFVPTSFEVQQLKPIFIQVDPEKTLRRNFFKAGFGNYTMPYAEFYSNSLSSDKYSLGFHVRHLSSKGEIKDHPVSAFSQNSAAIYGKRYLRNNVLSANVHYHRNVVHYYGFHPTDDTLLFSLPDEDLRQRYSLIGADVSLSSNHNRRNQANYMAGLNFHHLSDLYQTAETAIGLKSNLNSTNRLLRIANEEELGADLNLTLFRNADSLQSQANFMAALKPYLSLNFDYLDLTIGAEAAISADSASTFYIYPNVKAFFKVIPDYLRVYFTATGGLSRNSMRSISSQNPWVNPVFPMDFTSTKYDFKGGVTGKINALLDFNLSVSYADVENMLFFVNDFITPYSPEVAANFGNKFTALYDNAQVTTISVEVGYEQPERFNALLAASYRDYSLAEIERPWHRPTFEAALTTRYFVNPQISVSGDVLFTGKTYARVLANLPEPEIATIKAYLDLNLGAEYRFNDKVAAFAQVNNLTATRYNRWYGYPSQRINVMGGLSFAF